MVGTLALGFYSQPEVQDYFARLNAPAMSQQGRTSLDALKGHEVGLPHPVDHLG